jgi:hypothetical protein
MDNLTNFAPNDEPLADELAAIERESGLIAAEMALLDAEIRLLDAGDQASEIDWQRLRRATRDVAREAAELRREDHDDLDTYPGGDAA